MKNLNMMHMMSKRKIIILEYAPNFIFCTFKALEKSVVRLMRKIGSLI